MRRPASVFLFLLLLSASALADGTRFPEDTWAVVSNPNEGDCLNLREHPWQDSASLGKYYNGTQVLLVAEYEDSPDWAYVQVGQGAGSAEGFMMRRYLCMNPAKEAVLPVNPIRTLREDAALCSLRSTGEVRETLALLPAGTQVTVMGYTDAYLHVTVGSRVGYVPADAAGDGARRTLVCFEGMVGDYVTSAALEETEDGWLVRISAVYGWQMEPEHRLMAWQVHVDGHYAGDAAQADDPAQFLLMLPKGSSAPGQISLTPVLEAEGPSGHDMIILTIRME